MLDNKTAQNRNEIPMNTRNTILSLAVTVTIVAVAGCGSTRVTNKAQAQANWTDARASVSEGLARDQFRGGSIQQARQTIDQVLAMTDTRASSHLLSSQIAIEQGKLESAEKSLKRAQELDPKDSEIDYFMGIINQRWQRGEQALANYQAASTKKPADLAYTMAHAEMLVELNRLQEAIKLLENRVVYFESSSALRDTLAQLLERRGAPGDQARAIDLFRQAVVLEGKDNTARERWGIALYRAGQYPQSKSVLSRLLVDAEYAKRVDLMLAVANCELQLGLPSDARTRFEQVIALDARQVAGHVGVAKSSMLLEDFARAKIALSRAAAIKSDSVEVAMLQSTLSIKQQNWAQADGHLAKVLLLDPSNSTAMALSALAKSKLGQTEQSRQAMASAIKVNPNDEWVKQVKSMLQ